MERIEQWSEPTSPEGIELSTDFEVNLDSVDTQIEKWEMKLNESNELSITDEREMRLKVDELEILKTHFNEDEKKQISDIDARIKQIQGLLDPSRIAPSSHIGSVEEIDMKVTSVPELYEKLNAMPRPIEEVLAEAGVLDFEIIEGEASGTLTGEKRNDLRTRAQALLPELRNERSDASPEQQAELALMIKHFESV